MGHTLNGMDAILVIHCADTRYITLSLFMLRCPEHEKGIVDQETLLKEDLFSHN